MSLAQLAQAPGAERGGTEPDHPMVVGIRDPPDESRLLGPVDEADHAVVPEQQRLGDLPDRGSTPIDVPTDGQQQLVLRRTQTQSRRLLLTPVQEPPEPDPELE